MNSLNQYSRHNVDKYRNGSSSSLLKKFFKTFAFTFFTLLIFALIGAWLYIHSIEQEITIENTQVLSVEEQENLKTALKPSDEPNGVEYTLILGSDARPGEKAARSDTIILARLDPSNKQITFISIPRDTRVQIPGHGWQKINAAMAFGGPAGAINAVSEFANVPISHYAQVRFENLTELINKVGGVDVYVPQTFTSRHGGYTFEKGNQHMNGDQALSFARERYAFSRGDFQRSDNQRVLLEALLRKILKAPVTELPGLIQSLSKNVTTDYTVTELVNLAMTYRGDDLTIYSGLVPSSPKTIDGVSYVIHDEGAWQAMMDRVKQGLPPKENE